MSTMQIHVSDALDEKIAIFRGCFSGLPHVYGTYDPGTNHTWQVKQRVTDRVLLDHIEGRQPYGVYLLSGDRIRALAVDFDDEDVQPPTEFISAARTRGVSAYLERSKSKGYHVWLFFEATGVLAARARVFAHHLLAEIGRPRTEVFPKQDRLHGHSTYGNFINAPLFGALVPRGRSVFLDLDNALKPYTDQWALLKAVQRITACVLDALMPREQIRRAGAGVPGPRPATSADTMPTTFGLPPCAQRMLAEGVTEYQRVACFRLALHLKRVPIPQDIAVAGLVAWARKNRPRDGKGIITHAEIVEQTACAYASSYRGCGCEDPAIESYCDPRCPIKRTDQLKEHRGARARRLEPRSGFRTHPQSTKSIQQATVAGEEPHGAAGAKHNILLHSRAPPDFDSTSRQVCDSGLYRDGDDNRRCTMYETRQRPIKEFRAGGKGCISASIWRNEIDDETGKDGRTTVTYSVRIQKRYHDIKTDTWHNSDYYFADELPRIRLVIDKAYEFIKLRERDPQLDSVEDDVLPDGDVEVDAPVVEDV